MKEKKNLRYLEREKHWIYWMLIFVSGFYGAYTVSLKGGVFCNAQTANFVLFSVWLGKGEWIKALYYFIPMSAYFLGAVVSEILPDTFKEKYVVSWDTALILFEIVLILVIGALPDSVPHQISQVIINFICSMQYNTFKQAEGVPMATTFCTNHIRQTGVAFAHCLKHGDDTSKTRLFVHIRMLVFFVLGAVVSALLCRYVGGKTIWFTVIPLAIVFIDLLNADIKKIEAN